MVTRYLILCFAMLFALIPHPANAAENYPARQITLVVPFAAGGGTDSLGRLLAAKLSARVGKSVVVENKGGAGSMLGASAVAKSPPDGYTLLLVTNSTIAVTPILYKVPLIDPLQDFVPLVMVSGSPFFLVANRKLPADSVGDLIRLAKQRPKQLTYSSAGIGSTAHTFMELFMRLAQVELIHVPYKGSAQAINDVMAGHVDMTFTDPTVAIATLKSDHVKFVGISTKARHPAASEVPPISETGLPGYDALAWVAMVAPAQTPQDVVRKLRAEFTEIVQSPEFKEHLAKNGSVVLEQAGAGGVSEFFKSEVRTWGAALKDAGLAGTQ
jgi:tripartite-type tricarboxylate transporter receptor subunit TctC